MATCPACNEEVKPFAKICPWCQTNMNVYRKQSQDRENYLSAKYIKFTAPAAVISFLIFIFALGWHWFWSGVLSVCIYYWTGKFIAKVITGEEP